MISFIIIGRNEGIRLINCLTSITDFCSKNQIIDNEVIYVDSDSFDNSIELAKKFCTKILKLTGDINAAVARNEGARIASGDVLFFVDGDMELLSSFYSYAFNDTKLIYPFVSGYFINNYHDNSGTYLYSEIYLKSKPKVKDEFQVTTGGLFIITTEHWQNLGAMDTKFTTGEDLDLGLRSTKKGLKLLKINQPFAFHNTINYNLRLKLFNKNDIYVRSCLYRKHLFNKYLYKQILVRDPSLILLLFSLLIFLLSTSKLIILFYLTVVLFFSIITNSKNLIKVPFRFVYQVTRDCLNLVAFLFYFPQNKTEYKVVQYK
jgi:glycosyltransferase involved in cell wall biosynthesis